MVIQLRAKGLYRVTMGTKVEPNFVVEKAKYFKGHRKIWLFNICFLIERGSIRIKESSSNKNYMRNFLFMINFIKDCRGLDILHYYILTKNPTAIMSDFRHFPVA